MDGSCQDCLKFSKPLRREDVGKYLLCDGERVSLDDCCTRFVSASGLLAQMDRLIEMGHSIVNGES